jgi:hypothetical protein
MEQRAKWLAAVIVAGMLGCDKPPPPPPKVTANESADEAPAQPEDRRPKTADVMSGTWRTIPLGIHPLRVQVPDKWEVKMSGSATFLRGPTPNGLPPDGEINISVSKPPPFPKEMVKGLEESERRSATQPSTAPTTTSALNYFNARDLGPARVIEKRTAEPARGNLPAMMRWTVLAFVPLDANTVNVYQLSFMDLTPEQYEKDKALLEKIINSLEVDATTAIPSPRIDPLK